MKKRGRMMLEIGPTGPLISRPLRLGLVLLGAALLLIGLAACTTGANPDGPRLSLAETSHDFGQISSSQEMEYRFPLINVGNRPLEIGEIRLEPARPGG